MAIDFSKQQLHDPKDNEVQKLLEGIQGNILKGHGRDHTVHVFVKFDSPDTINLRENLVAVAGNFVTSALQQHVETVQFKRFKIPGALFGNIFLTANGYRALGFTEDQLESAFSDTLFLEGMPAHQTDFNDPSPTQWEKGYQDGDIDAMFLLADDDKDFLMRQARTFINRLDKFCNILVVELGDALRHKDNNEGIEHFGYVDGRSQPIYLLGDERDEGKIDKWNPIEPLNILLTKDKSVAEDNGNNFGSYFVFRKLEQNVLAFKTRELELASELGFTIDEEKERAGAMAVGRFEDGTPLVLSQTDGFIPKKENNFTYEDDDDNTATGKAGSLKCPYQAHIRKTNPRGDSVRRFGISDREERDHRITRRGITFGKREKHPNDAQAISDFPTKGVGLLFMCFQSDIQNQFAFMQHNWANNEGFVKGKVGIDPVIGQSNSASPSSQNWRPHYGDETEPDNPEDKETKEFLFHGFVKMKGGEFFFAPSMAFLRNFSA